LERDEEKPLHRRRIEKSRLPRRVAGHGKEVGAGYASPVLRKPKITTTLKRRSLVSTLSRRASIIEAVSLGMFGCYSASAQPHTYCNPMNIDYAHGPLPNFCGQGPASHPRRSGDHVVQRGLLSFFHEPVGLLVVRRHASVEFRLSQVSEAVAQGLRRPVRACHARFG